MRLLPAGCALLICAATASAADRWVATEHWGRFELRSEVPEGTRDSIARTLSRLEEDLTETLRLAVPEADGPAIQINVFRTERGYRRHLAARVPEAAARPAAFVQGTDMGRIYVVSGRSFQTNLQHEATHALLHQALPFVPLWLDEGLAVYFEVNRAERAFGSPNLSRVRWAMKFGWRPDLAELESRETLDEMSPGDYRHAWAWTHFLLHESDESRSVLIEYLADIRSGIPPGPLSLRIRDRMPDAPARLVKHFENWKRP